MTRRQLQGIVTSKKTDKTVTVKVERLLMHPKYKKRYTLSKKYLVHDQENKAKEGDIVTIKEARPISKLKRWVLVTVDKTA
ncbi:MAG: 30S ribosomal protein S17 [Candidatus Kerfeldbacteria bacterium CG08_land_8_20_14_0_20_42_7]|uniref:Small ribosomal subunit protein uS17 n=1 Tax=Candidatus Kerfeldbacteria bacterium CG08_land_8_20_14_0_20_42_7 TaxID=2014245 RepID=A0A2H0YT12_9BACT|nr:MAG: 30S ribosomal protein S17 [Candidatus Kerfeldbacteria bacterium CG08_land_8_20_14_0_20_42_7]